MKTQDNDIGRLNAHLAEATALLARVKTGDQQFASDIDQWFFRTAPQPEPTQAGSEAGAKYFDWDRAPAQPAAPTPECRYGESFCGDTGCPAHGIEEPAAPEPSADTENPDYCRGYTDGVNDGVREILSGKERADKLAVAIGNVTKNLDWHARAESAEAQLCAVRECLTGVHVMKSQDAGEVVCAWVVEDALALLTAPSPGEGEETL